MSIVDDHELWQERISASLDGELSPDEELLLQEHLAGCAQCRSAMALLRSMRAAIGADQARPPEKLAEGARYLFEQEKKKGPGLKRWRFTAIAAVICLALLGFAAFGPWGGSGSAAPRAVEAAAEKQTAGYLTSAGAAAPAGMAAEEPETEADTVAGVTDQGMPEPEPQATVYMTSREGEGLPDSVPAEAPGAAAAGGAESAPETAEEGAQMNGFGNSVKSPLYSADSLPGYGVYRELENASGYYSVSFVYGPVPDTIRENRECTLLDSPEGQERWLVPLSVCMNEGLMEQFNEIYYGDLLSERGLVIGLTDIEEGEWLP